jgi:hypothetical protein
VQSSGFLALPPCSTIAGSLDQGIVERWPGMAVWAVTPQAARSSATASRPANVKRQGLVVADHFMFI